MASHHSHHIGRLAGHCLAWLARRPIALVYNNLSRSARYPKYY
jgi:hypothetical protein